MLSNPAMVPRTSVVPFALALALSACGKAEPLAAPDPTGHDLVEGAVVAAATSAESTPGMRTYKIVHVDDYPNPVGWELHMIVYDPKAPTFEEAARIRKDKGSKGMTVVSPHIEVRLSDFMPRDHRVIAKEPVSDEEKAAYLAARDHRMQMR
jgi:hypothetical protein